MATVTCILGSSQEEMTMLASGSEDTSYLSSVTAWEVRMPREAQRSGRGLRPWGRRWWARAGSTVQSRRAACVWTCVL